MSQDTVWSVPGEEDREEDDCHDDTDTADGDGGDQAGDEDTPNHPWHDCRRTGGTGSYLDTACCGCI